MFARQMITAALLMALSAQQVSACLWDRDTLAFEGSQYGEILNVIAGRFPRNPDIFYEARLARVTREIADDPDNLGLYDDAGVACDRLHRPAEAIAWMEKKAAILATDPDPDHEYRYHANLGTFLIHRWLRAGAKADQPEGKQGAEHIRKAIGINPDAHFGREAIQLQAIEWILAERGATIVPPREDNLFWHLHEKGYLPDEINRTKALEGLAGLVTLGAAWESVDVFDAMARVFRDQDDSSMAMLAQLRVAELFEDGRRSLAPDSPDSYSVAEGGLQFSGHVKKWFRKARRAADSWQAARDRYIGDQIAAGKHPDTHPDFWDGFDEDQHRLPKLPHNSPTPTGRLINGIKIAVIICGSLLIAILACRTIIRRTRTCSRA